ncbi:hypothetical protein [Echinicola strongylocentroti]|uniref:hypothetical protein n=1 Tax=Echinicola strongylocentroti TaxID=1795355 RepID=UPI0013A6D394|nr:hypothetical protein [Echinicola strongylocentroti]
MAFLFRNISQFTSEVIFINQFPEKQTIRLILDINSFLQRIKFCVLSSSFSGKSHSTLFTIWANDVLPKSSNMIIIPLIFQLVASGIG